ncbi:MAG: hypothetical protein AB1567_13675 [bacterium]
MTWLQILAQGAIIATFLGVGIAAAAYFNGKHIKEGVRETKEIINDIVKMVKEGQRETRQLIDKIDSRAEERHREVLHALKLI